MFFSARIRAEEPFVPFLDALRSAGYGEAALDYIDQIEKRPGTPVALLEILDLQRAQSLLVAAEETEHRDIAEQRMTAAKGFLDKFLKEHGEHELASSAFAAAADLETQRGKALLRQVRLQKDAAAKTPLLTEARAAFDLAAPKYATAVDRYAKRFARLIAEKQDGKKSISKRDEEILRAAELDWLEIRGKAALLDYYQAQTFPDPKDAGRKAALTKAGDALDKIYQRERAKTEGLTGTGIYAHMWHGKVLEELGDLTAALDIYDEVLANAPTKEDRRAASSPLAPLFAQVEYFRLLILLKNKELQQFVGEAKQWLDDHQRSEKTNGFQGISLELAQALGALAESAKPEDARKLKREALSILSKMVNVTSEFQQDAIVLRRLMGDVKEEVKNYKEAIAMGQAAVEGNQLNDAITYYTQAIALAANDKTVKPEEVINSQYRLANIQWAAGKLDDALKTAEGIISQHGTSPVAPSAAAIALNAAKAKYFAETKADSKAAALQQLVKLADQTIQKWPDRAEADDARIAVGQAHLVRGELDAASKAFATVKPESVRFPQALQQAGQVDWQLYLQEKAKPPSQRDANRMATLLAEAEKKLIQSLGLERAKIKQGEPTPKQLLDSELLLAEVSLEANKPEEAAKLVEPLIQAASAGGSLDRTRLRTFLAAVRAYVAVKNFDKAASVAAVLLESGDDSPVVNQVLVDFARMLDSEYKRLQAQALTAANANDAKLKEAADSTAKSVQALFAKVIEQLAARRHHNVTNMIYLSETSAEIGLTEKAREQFMAILKKASEEKGSVPPQAEIRIRAKLIGLLRNEKKFAEALPEVDKLIQATGSRALEPLVEKGFILQSRAESVPFDAKLYDAALTYWTELRLRLQNMKPRPPEYYQVMYNSALCLMVQAEQTNNVVKAQQVVQLLNSVLTLNRTVLAADLVTKYDALVAKARQLQSRLAPGKK